MRNISGIIAALGLCLILGTSGSVGLKTLMVFVGIILLFIGNIIKAATRVDRLVAGTSLYEALSRSQK